jgi:hypothetical protein
MARIERRDRAISITFGYVIALAITTVLIAGLLTAGSTFLRDQREDVVRAEFQEIGQQLAHDITAADRAQQSATGNDSIRIRSELPQDIGGQSYRVLIRPRGGDRHQIVMRANNPSVNQTVTFRAQSDIDTSAVAGGTVVIRSVNATTLEVTNEDGIA